MYSALLIWIGSMSAWAATVYDTPETLATDPGASCGLDVLDFEEHDLSTGETVDDYYLAADGVVLDALVDGLLVSSTVGGQWGLCRGERCGLVRIDEDVAYADDFDDTVRTWLYVLFDAPVKAFGAWFIDVDEALDVQGWSDPAADPIESFTLDVAGDDAAGGVFAGLGFSEGITALLITSTRVVDEWAIDDVYVPPAECHDLDGDGYAPAEGDCDDQDAAIHPEAEEICDGIDNNCDGVLLDGENDPDGDGWLECEDPDDDGWAAVDGDCAVLDATIHPEATEVCDGIDNNCDNLLLDGEDDPDRDGWLECEDPDGDGWAAVDGDCAPFDETIHPEAAEVCDGIDNDCDGALLDGEDDPDRDGWLECEDPDNDGWSAVEGDCGPLDPNTWPDAPELCDGIDNDCDGAPDADELDVDLDGFAGCDGDCNDEDPTIHPYAVELPNAVDADCDGRVSGGQAGGCDTSGGSAAWLGLVGLALLAIRRRREVAVVAGVCASGPAFAGSDTGGSFWSCCGDCPVSFEAVTGYQYDHAHQWGYGGVGVVVTPQWRSNLGFVAEARYAVTTWPLYMSRWETTEGLWTFAAGARWMPLPDAHVRPLVALSVYGEPTVTAGLEPAAGVHLGFSWGAVEAGVAGNVALHDALGRLGGRGFVSVLLSPGGR